MELAVRLELLAVERDRHGGSRPRVGIAAGADAREHRRAAQGRFLEAGRLDRPAGDVGLQPHPQRTSRGPALDARNGAFDAEPVEVRSQRVAGRLERAMEDAPRLRDVVRPRIAPSAARGSKWGVIGRPKVGCITMPDGRPDMATAAEHVVERHVGEELATHPLDDCAGEPNAGRVHEPPGTTSA